MKNPKCRKKNRSKLMATPDIVTKTGCIIPGIKKDSAKGTKADYTKCN